MPADNRPLEQIASDFQLGLTNIMEANPASTPIPAQGGQHADHSPSADPAQRPREGIVINVAEMRLYYYPKGKNVVHVLPIGIGQLGVNTPENWITRLSASVPTRPGPRPRISVAATPPRARPCPRSGWPARTTPWASARALHRQPVRHPRHQRHLRHRSAGEQRLRALRADDIQYLFDHVPVGTRVQFVNQPVKTTGRAGWRSLHGSAQSRCRAPRKSSTPPPPCRCP